MNREQSNIKLKTFSDKFLIIGYKPNGQRCIPLKYEWVIETAIDENSICDKTRGLIDFNVFLIEEGPFSFDQWINIINSKSKERTEKEEKELLKQLKAKYE